MDYGTVGHFSWLLASREGIIKAELPLRLQRFGLNFRGTDNEWKGRKYVGSKELGFAVLARVRS